MEITVDIHGMSELEAQKHLEDVLRRAERGVEYIRVIHGHTRGQTLAQMVRSPNKLRSRRIIRRRLTMNQGETLLEIE